MNMTATTNEFGPEYSENLSEVKANTFSGAKCICSTEDELINLAMETSSPLASTFEIGADKIVFLLVSTGSSPKRVAVIGAGVSVSGFFQRHFGKEVVDYLIDPFVAGTCGGDPDLLSVNAPHISKVVESREKIGGTEEEKARELKEAFRMYEMEGCGCITPKSLKRMLDRLGETRTVDECRGMIARYDINGDGLLNFDEFMIMMRC
ncbi:hypothetical protein RND71_020636 [Anisodus tanguticus]|uniref:EF-hand domain-containing protein n=1 Tax=Anisodus tanguticus TaxID=243964 RepID=A0AAE1S2J0_9SOLA|nr:hypothetical protein RND71_020636 [Anisodus tanguticus]